MSVTVFCVMCVAVIVLVAVIVYLYRLRQAGKDARLCFESKSALFSQAERSFLAVLEQALDSHHRVFCKVRLGDLVKPGRNMLIGKQRLFRSKLNTKHVDFVICRTTDLSVAAIVELDDQTGSRHGRAGRDTLVDQALSQSMLPIIHFSAQTTHTVEEIRTELKSSIFLKPDPAPSDTFRPESVPADKPKAVKQGVFEPICPKCSSLMVKRQVKVGPHAGKYIHACSAYPACRHALPYHH